MDAIEHNTNEEPLRLFAAVAIPSETKKQITSLIGDLRKGAQFTGAYPAWVKPEGVHLTLVFFGNQPQQRVEAIQRAMAGAAHDLTHFSLALSRLELFPNPRNPRVICVGLQQGVERLKQLQQRMAQFCRIEGFEVEEREFKPHLTLARIKSARGLAGLRDLVQNHSGFRTPSFEVGKMTLYRSILRREGAEYQVLHEQPFG